MRLVWVNGESVNNLRLKFEVAIQNAKSFFFLTGSRNWIVVCYIYPTLSELVTVTKR